MPRSLLVVRGAGKNALKSLLCAAAPALAACASFSEDTSSFPAGLFLVDQVDGRTPPSGAIASLRFDAGGRISGSAGCNRIMGLVRLAGDDLAFADLASTRRACEPEVMAFEERLLASLRMARSYLSAPDGAIMLVTPDGGSVRLSRTPPDQEQ